MLPLPCSFLCLLLRGGAWQALWLTCAHLLKWILMLLKDFLFRRASLMVFKIDPDAEGEQVCRIYRRPAEAMLADTCCSTPPSIATWVSSTPLKHGGKLLITSNICCQGWVLLVRNGDSWQVLTVCKVPFGRSMPRCIRLTATYCLLLRCNCQCHQKSVRLICLSWQIAVNYLFQRYFSLRCPSMSRLEFQLTLKRKSVQM